MKLCGVATCDFGVSQNETNVNWNLFYFSQDLLHLLSGIYTPQHWIYNLQNPAWTAGGDWKGPPSLSLSLGFVPKVGRPVLPKEAKLVPSMGVEPAKATLPRPRAYG